MSDRDALPSALIFLAVGAALGAAVAMLYAPAPGTETRDRLRRALPGRGKGHAATDALSAARAEAGLDVDTL